MNGRSAGVLPTKRSSTRRGDPFESSVATILALGFRIIESREYTYADAQREFGIALRTYRRYLARLRGAGLILHSPNQYSEPCSKRGLGLVRFIAYDRLFANKSTAA
jgi:hypothetical protein